MSPKSRHLEKNSLHSIKLVLSPDTLLKKKKKRTLGGANAAGSLKQ